MNPDQQLAADISEWQQLKEWMKTAKERETYLRQSIAARMFDSIKLPTGAYPEGTNHLTKALAGGPTYHGSLGSTWKRDVIEEQIVPVLTEAQLAPDVQKDLLKMNPVLSVTVYRSLPADKQRIVDKMLLLKQGAITLDLTEIPK